MFYLKKMFLSISENTRKTPVTKLQAFEEKTLLKKIVKKETPILLYKASLVATSELFFIKTYSVVTRHFPINEMALFIKN